MTKNSVSPDSSAYPFIWWWGNEIASPAHYIRQREADAIASEAPAGAILRNPDGEWELITQIRNARTLRSLRDSSPELYMKAIELAETTDDQEFLQLSQDIGSREIS